MNRPTFPIDELLPRIHASLAAHPRLVLEAPPGAGKTTQVPPALLDAPWLAGRKILMLEPRRVAARAAAHFMAAQRGERVGQTIGYRIRFDHQVSAATRIEVVTEGILTRMIQDDPTLGEGRPDGVGAVVFDEFHERHLAADLGLALALDVQAALREDLRIVVMSATLDGARLAQFLDAPRLSSAGRSYPVSIAHFPARRDEKLEPQTRRAVEHALAQHPGDVLVFLPGQREIARVEAALSRALPPLPPGEGRGEGSAKRQGPPLAASPNPHTPRVLPAGRPPGACPEQRRRGHLLSPAHPFGAPEGEGNQQRVQVLALHGDLPVEQQSRVLQPDPDGRRRVVLATNVAESSVTLPGVRVVIDAGLAREPRYDPNSGFSRLDVVAIAQASADQRAGRAGRVAEGWAYRLWPPSQRLEPQRRPEIAQVELSGLALELAAWGEANLRFIDAPPPGALAAARELLQRLGALDAGANPAAASITPLGRRMLALGTHPRLAAMLLAPDDPAERALACDLAALVEARDPLRSRSDAWAERWQALAAFRGLSPLLAKQGEVGRGSLFARTRAAHAPPPQPVRPASGGGSSSNALAAIDAAAKQWRRRLHVDAPPPSNIPAHALGDVLLHAFPDRIARQHPGDPARYQLANGRSAKLFDDSALYGEPWLVISELRAQRPTPGDRSDSLVLRAAPLDEARLQREFPQRFNTEDRVQWQADTRAITAVRERRFDRIVLESRHLAKPNDKQWSSRYAEALTDAVRQLGLVSLPWSESLSQWRARVRCLRAWLPAMTSLPDLSDSALMATLDEWLKPALAGKTRLAALDQSQFGEALKTVLDWSLRQQIDVLVPTRITVPSGMERPIHYAFDDETGQAVAPVLAVKLQELFGLADTPRIADGRVPLTLHLLSPGGRPLQVTQDLKGFWQRTYPEVKKEMKGRYPKHPWPDDPWTATATHRAKPRG